MPELPEMQHGVFCDAMDQEGGPGEVGQLSFVGGNGSTIIYRGPMLNSVIVRTLDPEYDMSLKVPKVGDADFLTILRRVVGDKGQLIINPSEELPDGVICVETDLGHCSQQITKTQTQTSFSKTKKEIAQNVIRINLHSQSAEGEFDNAASVEVECDNVDAVINRMLEKLIDKFPAETVATIERSAVWNASEKNIHTQTSNVTNNYAHSTSNFSKNDSKSRSQLGSQLGSRQFSHQLVPQYSALGPQLSDLKSSSELARTAYQHVPVIEDVQIPYSNNEIQYHHQHKIVNRGVSQTREFVSNIPQTVYEDVYREVPQYVEIVKEVPVKQIIDNHVEHITYVPKIEIRQVEREVQIPSRDGKIIRIPKTFIVEQEEKVIVFKDTFVPCVVSQKLAPVIQQCDEEIEVEAKRYVPCLVPVDVYIPRPVHIPLVPVEGGPSKEYAPVQVPEAQFNTLLLDINPQLRNENRKLLPTIRAPDGTIPLLVGAEAMIADFEIDINNTPDFTMLQHMKQQSSQLQMPTEPRDMDSSRKDSHVSIRNS